MKFQKEIRQYVAAGFFICLLVAMVGYLTFIPLPTQNENVIIAIIGVLVGGAAPAMARLFGDDDREKDELKDRLRSVEKSLSVAEAKHTTLDHKYDKLMEMLVDRHVVEGQGISVGEPT